MFKYHYKRNKKQCPICGGQLVTICSSPKPFACRYSLAGEEEVVLSV